MAKGVKGNILLQGSVLAIASIIVRLIGLLYRIPLVNLLGDEGNGYYSSAYTVYAYLLILSSYGLPSAISKLISHKMAQKDRKSVPHIFQASLVFSGTIGCVFGLLLFFFAPLIANEVFVMPNAVWALRGLAPGLIVLSFLSVFRGYFQGMNTMVPTAISQIVEQIFNAVFSLLLAYAFFSQGVAYAAAGSSLGTVTGALTGLIFLFFLYKLSKRKNRRREKAVKPLKLKEMPSYWKMLLAISIPMVLGTSTFHLTNLVDTIMFNKALAYHQYSSELIATLYGLLEGRYKIIITLPVALASALATASIPSITTSLVRNDKQLLGKKVELAIRSIFMVTIPAAVGIFVFAKPILQLLFWDQTYLILTSTLLKIGSLSVLFFGLSTISIGLLQGLNEMTLPIKHAAIAMLVKIAFNVFFLFYLDWNLYGAVITNIIFALISALLNFHALNKRVRIHMNIYKAVVAPFLSAVAMGIGSLVLFMVLKLVISQNASLIISIIVAIVIYGGGLIGFRIFDNEELDSMPFGNYIKKIYRRF